MAKLAVIGLGNLLLKDDGIGPRVVRELNKCVLPPGVNAVEAGGSFFRYWDLLLECRYVIAVDSMLGNGPAGSIYLLTPEQLTVSSPVPGIRHEVHFLEVLKTASFLGAKPEVTIIGIEPKEISFSTDLSPEIAAKLPGVVRVVWEKCMSLAGPGLELPAVANKNKNRNIHRLKSHASKPPLRPSRRLTQTCAPPMSRRGNILEPQDNKKMHR